MWIMTPTSFVSIVAHRSKPDALLVRARLKGDLQRLFPGCKPKTTPAADYRFRIEVSREKAAAVIAGELRRLSYDNVKGAIPKGKAHDARDRAMHATWAVWHKEQVQQAGACAEPRAYPREALDDDRELGW